ncbi:XRE family transcriptional regulator [Pseudomonas yamanorum]|jgi:transcriptional regulator with XRE-family HTH domain|uniref:Helix-turn-helix domain-containing protein n=1 Tax=Pseudomonas yamanorum TaxID=515393 RepID=A0AAJ3LI80_9PSED|nr:XRE family transcriptional regulator [Pseudomonas yamanorum]NVZ92454.1 helix-turn-helix domain-containing protein [Pseudomonas yamanorum]NWD43885.1 helix-turn-helix domain-containing protein [Pseudomonas yamanorum]
MTDITNNSFNNNTSRIDLLALSIKRERQLAGLSLTELAKRAGVAKSTLSQLESGIGNPSIETLWSLATAMGLQVTRFFEQPQQHLRVIRANEGLTTYAETGHYAATLLADCPAGMRRDIYRLKVQPGEVRLSQPHPAGTVEHVVLCSGSANIGPANEPVLLYAGDYISYLANAPHVFEALEADTTAVMVIEHP